jgi:hypothetical protein
VGINQYLTTNEVHLDVNIEVFGLADRYIGTYGSTELFALWTIPLGIAVGDFGEITYIPGISGKINYPYRKMDEPRKPVQTFSHSIGFGRVNWIGNYQKGLTASIGNAFNWYLDRPDYPYAITLDETAAFHWPFTDYFGLYTRLQHRTWWQWANNERVPYYYAGDTIRGVLDEYIRAYYMVSFNLDFPIRVLRFLPSEWKKNPKLRILDFEMHFSPFTDLALFHGTYSKLKNRQFPETPNTQFKLSDMVNTLGFEVSIFPGFFRSFIIRGSFGFDIKNRETEIYIGLERHY